MNKKDYSIFFHFKALQTKYAYLQLKTQNSFFSCTGMISTSNIRISVPHKFILCIRFLKLYISVYFFLFNQNVACSEIKKLQIIILVVRYLPTMCFSAVESSFLPDGVSKSAITQRVTEEITSSESFKQSNQIQHLQVIKHRKKYGKACLVSKYDSLFLYVYVGIYTLLKCYESNSLPKLYTNADNYMEGQSLRTLLWNTFTREESCTVAFPIPVLVNQLHPSYIHCK